MPCGSYFSTVVVKKKKVRKIFHNICYLIPANFFSRPIKNKTPLRRRGASIVNRDVVAVGVGGAD